LFITQHNLFFWQVDIIKWAQEKTAADYNQETVTDEAMILSDINVKCKEFLDYYNELQPTTLDAEDEIQPEDELKENEAHTTMDTHINPSSASVCKGSSNSTPFCEGGSREGGHEQKNPNTFERKSR